MSNNSPHSPFPPLLGARGLGGAFSNTNWSVVVKAGGGAESPVRNSALETLCRTYWPPLYAWLRGAGHSAEDAEDLVQSLFLEILSGDALAGLEQGKGRFRSFLITLLKNRSVDEFRRRSAAKRGGGVAFVPLDLEKGEQLVPAAASAESPEEAFDRNWAHTVIREAMHDLEENYAVAGKSALYKVIRPCLFAPAERTGYENLAQGLGMSRGAVAMSVKRMRERFGELIARRVAETVSDPADVRDEMRYLLSLFASG